MVYVVTAVTAGLSLPRIERALLPGSVASVSPQAAVAIASTIGSGMLAFTGIVFSLAFVMVQFSATAYSPRLVLWFARDPVVAHSIGIFTATFLYSIAALAWIDRSGSGKVPFFSMWLVIALLLTSIAMFVVLMQKIGQLQINRTLAFIGDQGRRVIEEIYPPLDTPAETAELGHFATSHSTQTLVHTGQPQALTAVDAPALLTLATSHDVLVEVVSSVGDTLVTGTPVLRVFGGKPIVDEYAWKRAVQVGDERTFEQDPKYAIRLLVDVAIKALSPAVNDPTTAVQALDQIEDLLQRLGRRRLEIGAIRDHAGGLRLIIPFPTWDDYLTLAFEEIRFYGATSVQVMRRLTALVSDLILALPRERQGSLRDYQQRLASTIARSFAAVEERLKASTEDRQGLGVPRRHQAGV